MLKVVKLENLITPAEQTELYLGILLMPFYLRGEFPCPKR